MNSTVQGGKVETEESEAALVDVDVSIKTSPNGNAIDRNLHSHDRIEVPCGHRVVLLTVIGWSNSSSAH